jgi:hypothetical protein
MPARLKIRTEGLLYHFLQRELWEEDVWLFQSLASRLILRLGIWISQEAYSRIPWLVPYARRDPLSRGSKKLGIADQWGSPDEEGYCFLRVKAPNRSFLVVFQVEAFLDAARLLDGEHREFSWREVCAIRVDSRPATQVAREFGVSETLIRRIRRNEIWKEPGRRHVARLPLAGALVLSGPRITELCRLDSPDDIDLAARAVRIPRVKTDAAERVVPMVPTLHEILLGDRIERRPDRSAGFPDA